MQRRHPAASHRNATPQCTCCRCSLRCLAPALFPCNFRGCVAQNRAKGQKRACQCLCLCLCVSLCLCVYMRLHTRQRGTKAIIKKAQSQCTPMYTRLTTSPPGYRERQTHRAVHGTDASCRELGEPVSHNARVQINTSSPQKGREGTHTHTRTHARTHTHALDAIAANGADVACELLTRETRGGVVLTHTCKEGERA